MRKAASNNPWQILLVALPFYIGGIIMLMSRGQSTMMFENYVFQGNFIAPESATAMVVKNGEAHAFGAIGVFVGVLLTLFYFRLRNSIKRDE